MSNLIIMILVSAILYFFSKLVSTNGVGMLPFIILFWSLQIILSYAGTLGAYEWGYKGVLWLYIMMFFLVASWYIGKKTTENKNDVNYEDYDNNYTISNIAWMLLDVLIILGIIKWIYEISLNGFHLRDFFSLNSLATMNNSFAVARYSGGANQNQVTQILNIAVYAAPLIGGFALNFSQEMKQKWNCICSVFPALLVTLTVNTKATLIGAIILYISGYMTSYHLKNKEGIRLKPKIVLTVIVVIIGFALLMVFSMMLRIGEISGRTFAIVMRKLVIYIFGNVQTFDVWLSDYWKDSTFTNGGMTFLGVSSSLGLMTRVQGVYTSLQGTSSNVFTAFRGIIEDYGSVGGIIFTSLIGFITGLSEGIIYRANKIKELACFIMSATCFFFVYGFIISPWTYLSYIFAMIIFGIWMSIARRNSVILLYNNKPIFRSGDPTKEELI